MSSVVDGVSNSRQGAFCPPPSPSACMVPGSAAVQEEQDPPTDLQPRRTDPHLGGWKCASCLIGASGLNTLALNGITLNLVIYLVQICGQTNAAAANIVAYISGTLYVCSFVGALVGDAYMGRFWAAVIFQIPATLSYLVVNMAVAAISHSSALAFARPFFFVSLCLMTFTSGPLFPNIFVLGADQLSSSEDKETYFKVLTISNLTGQLLSVTLVTYINNKGMWVWGFGLCTLASVVGAALIAGGARWFHKHKASGNPFLRNVQVLVAAWRKRSLTLPMDTSLLYECEDNLSAIPGHCKLQHTSTLSFLDKAAVVGQKETFSPWHLCTVSQVEELKSLLRVMPAGIAIVFVSLAGTQTTTLFEEQANAMNREVAPWLTIPSASINLFSMGSAVLTGITITTGGTRLVEWCFGCGRKLGQALKATSLRTLGAALVSDILAMVIAALVESYRLSRAKEGFLISVMWLLPQTVLVGVSLNLVQSSSFNFLYSEVPDSVRTVGGSFQMIFVGAGGYISSILVTVVTAITTHGGQAGWIADNLNQGHVDYFYWLVASCSILGLCVYLTFARSYTYARRSYKDDPFESTDDILIQNLLE